MGCSGSKIVDIKEDETVPSETKQKSSKTNSSNNFNKQNKSSSKSTLADKGHIYYENTLNKITKLAKSNIQLIKDIPYEEESRKEYYHEIKDTLDKYKLSEHEFYDGALWMEMHDSFEPDIIDLIDLYTDIFIHSYSYESKARERSKEFNKKLGEIKNYNFFKQKGILVQDDEDDKIFEKLIEFISYDSKVEEMEAVSFILRESQYKNAVIIKKIADAISKFNNVVSIVIVLGKPDDTKEHEEINFDYFISVFEAVTNNTNIHAFGIITPASVTLNFSQKNQAKIVEMFKNNEQLTLATLSKINLEPKYFKSLISTIANHNSIYAFGYDMYGEFNDEYFKIFTEALKKSKNWTIGCFYNGESEVDIDNRHNIVDKFSQDKFLAISLPFSLH